ncbi:MAG TPA: hypothetical protein VK681_39330 [Reyranella sp.]|nr:hypothetical protein [Reyranella sp.]
MSATLGGAGGYGGVFRHYPMQVHQVFPKQPVGAPAVGLPPISPSGPGLFSSAPFPYAAVMLASKPVLMAVGAAAAGLLSHPAARPISFHTAPHPYAAVQLVSAPKLLPVGNPPVGAAHLRETPSIYFRVQYPSEQLQLPPQLLPPPVIVASTPSAQTLAAFYAAHAHLWRIPFPSEQFTQQLPLASVGNPGIAPFDTAAFYANQRASSTGGYGIAFLDQVAVGGDAPAAFFDSATWYYRFGPLWRTPYPSVQLQLRTPLIPPPVIVPGSAGPMMLAEFYARQASQWRAPYPQIQLALGASMLPPIGGAPVGAPTPAAWPIRFFAAPYPAVQLAYRALLVPIGDPSPILTLQGQWAAAAYAPNYPFAQLFLPTPRLGAPVIVVPTIADLLSPLYLRLAHLWRVPTSILPFQNPGSGWMPVTDGGIIVVPPVVVIGKYKPEHDSAFIDVGLAHGFAAEHASALKDVGDAGV